MIQTSFFPQPEKDKPIKLIQKINTSIFQPRKVEELVPDIDILPDTYIIYPRGGYHLFYGVPNTFPRYQLPIWPYVKRIKFSEKISANGRNNIRKGILRDNQNSSQVNAYLSEGYCTITIFRTTKFLRNSYTRKTKKGHSSWYAQRGQPLSLHRLVALAWIPNPEKKKNVCHINDDRTNYLIENLQWGTSGENQKGSIFRHPDTMEQKYLGLVNKGIIKG